MDLLEQAASLIFGTNADSYIVASSGQEVLPNLVLREEHHEEVRVTEQPVEIGAAITDHSFNMPSDLHLTYGWSNASIKGLIGNFSGGLLSRGIRNFGENYCFKIYNQLYALKLNRYLCKVVTYKRVYENMIITDVRTSTDAETTYSMIVDITLKQIFMVSANPPGGGVPSSGTKQLVSVDQVPNV